MGNTLSPSDIKYIREDMEKAAVEFTGLRELAKRIGSPLVGLSRGWKALSPSKLIEQGGEAATDLSSAISRTRAAQQALKTSKPVKILDATGSPVQNILGKEKMYRGDTHLGRARAYLATKLRAGTHLEPNADLSSGIRGLAERASRSGWTGEGAVTKYMPIGQKSMLGLGVAASAPGIVDAARYGPSEQFGGVGEQAGVLAGFALPAVMFAGMPKSSLVAPILGGFAGGRLGKALDRRFDSRVREIEGAST